MSRRFSAVLLVALVTAACSGGSSGSTVSTQDPQEPVGVPTIDMSDYRFAPTRVTVTEGSPAEFNLRNSGSVVHNWTVLTGEITAETEFDETMVLFTAEAVAGAQSRFAFEPPPAGVYQVICTIPTHFSQGMEGSLVVETG